MPKNNKRGLEYCEIISIEEVTFETMQCRLTMFNDKYEVTYDETARTETLRDGKLERFSKVVGFLPNVRYDSHDKKHLEWVVDETHVGLRWTKTCKYIDYIYIYIYIYI